MCYQNNEKGKRKRKEKGSAEERIVEKEKGGFQKKEIRKGKRKKEKTKEKEKVRRKKKKDKEKNVDTS